MKPLKCKLCNKRFDLNWQVAQHHRLKHPKPKVLPLPLAPLTEEAVTPNGVKPQYFKVNYCPHCGVHLDKVDLY